MNDEKIRQVISDTVTATVLKLKTAGMLRTDTMSAYEKTEAILRQYPQLVDSDDPYAMRVVQEVDACLSEAKNDPYAEVIRLFYFHGLKNTACAKALYCDERTARRYRKKLVQRFSVRLASDEFIHELLL